jgi:hypothetical protein
MKKVVTIAAKQGLSFEEVFPVLSEACSLNGNSRQAGRKTVQPNHSFDYYKVGLDIFADDFRRLLKKHDAPDHWNNEIAFFFDCLSLPESVDSLFFDGAKITTKAWTTIPLPGINRPILIPINALEALRFAHLYAEAPLPFLRVLLEMDQLIKDRVKLPAWIVAMVLANDPKSWNCKARELVDRIKKLLPGLSVTAKTVEHTRRRLRKIMPC